MDEPLKHGVEEQEEDDQQRVAIEDGSVQHLGAHSQSSGSSDVEELLETEFDDGTVALEVLNQALEKLKGAPQREAQKPPEAQPDDCWIPDSMLVMHQDTLKVHRVRPNDKMHLYCGRLNGSKFAEVDVPFEPLVPCRDCFGSATPKQLGWLYSEDHL